MGILSLDILDLDDVEHILQQSVVHQYIIHLCYFLLLWAELHLYLWNLLLEDLLPLSLKLFPAHHAVRLCDAGVGLEHGRVAIAKFEIEFSHVPFPGGFVELGEVLGKEVEVLLADVLELDQVVVAVKLEGTVHDSAVVETGDGDEVAGLQSWLVSIT